MQVRVGVFWAAGLVVVGRVIAGCWRRRRDGVEEQVPGLAGWQAGVNAAVDVDVDVDARPVGARCIAVGAVMQCAAGAVLCRLDCSPARQMLASGSW